MSKDCGKKKDKHQRRELIVYHVEKEKEDIVERRENNVGKRDLAKRR